MKSFLKPPLEQRNGYKDPKRLAAIHKLECLACKKIRVIQIHATEAHHLIGYGIGKKASDIFSIPLCSLHHARGNRGQAVHETPLKEWESVYGSQEELLELTNKMLENL